VEQDQLLAGVDDGRDERVLDPFRIDVVRGRQRVHLARWMLAAVARVQPVARHLAVEDVGDFELAELEAVDGRLQFALHRCGHGWSSRVTDVGIVGWVERSETHRLNRRRRWVSLTLNPSYGDRFRLRAFGLRSSTLRTSVFMRTSLRRRFSSCAPVSRYS